MKRINNISLLLQLVIISSFFALQSTSTSEHDNNVTLHNVDPSCQGDRSECECPCDASVGKCDLNCCCDSDCSREEISYFESCGNEKTDYRYLKDVQTARKCKRKRSIMIDKNNSNKPNFNLKRLSDFVENEMQELLCVQYDNSAVTGEYLDHSNGDGEGLSARSIDRQMKTNDFNFVQSDIVPSNDPEEGFYRIGEHIPTLRSTYPGDGQSQYSLESTLSLPDAGDGGFCNSNNAVRFGIDTKTSCWVTIEDLEKSCKQSLDVDKFVAPSIQVLKAKGSNDSTSPDDENSDDTLVDIKIESFLSTKGDNINATVSPLTIWDSDGNTCNHALQSLKYQIHYDSNRVIQEVKAIIVGTNVGNTSIIMKQDFEIEFMLTDSENSPSLIPNDKVDKDVGNVGYQFASPTVAGTLQGEKVKSSTTGLKIMNAGSCIQNNSMTIGFGEDISVSCTVPFNMEELKDFCVSSNHIYLTKAGTPENFFLPTWLIQDQDVIGIYDNANSDEPQEWLTISSSLDDPNFIGRSRVWNPSKKSCEGMTTTLRYRFFWTYGGSLHNPQAKIIRVTKEYDEDIPLIHKIQDNYKQQFRFTTTVSWTYLEPSKNVEHLSLPTFLFSVPDDVFYPFQRSRSSQGKVSTSWVVLFLCFVAISMI